MIVSTNFLENRPHILFHITYYIKKNFFLIAGLLILLAIALHAKFGN